jgi:hypothetical protein
MARGFESKSVDEQRLDAEAARELRSKEKLERGEIERRKLREGLELSRTRIRRELDETKSDRRREQLRAALQHLETQLKKTE